MSLMSTSGKTYQSFMCPICASVLDMNLLVLEHLQNFLLHAQLNKLR